MGASGATPHPASQPSRATDGTASAAPSLAPSAPRIAAFAPPNDAGTARAAKAALLIAAATALTDRAAKAAELSAAAAAPTTTAPTPTDHTTSKLARHSTAPQPTTHGSVSDEIRVATRTAAPFGFTVPGGLAPAPSSSLVTAAGSAVPQWSAPPPSVPMRPCGTGATNGDDYRWREAPPATTTHPNLDLPTPHLKGGSVHTGGGRRMYPAIGDPAVLSATTSAPPSPPPLPSSSSAAVRFGGRKLFCVDADRASDQSTFNHRGSATALETSPALPSGLHASNGGRGYMVRRDAPRRSSPSTTLQPADPPRSTEPQRADRSREATIQDTTVELGGKAGSYATERARGQALVRSPGTSSTVGGQRPDGPLSPTGRTRGDRKRAHPLGEFAAFDLGKR